MKRSQYVMKTKIGTFYLVASEIGLQGLFWKKQNVPMAKTLKSSEKDIKILVKTIRQLEEYLAGKRMAFDLTFDVSGTEFQKKVWNELSKIPYGETRSYKDIACLLNNEKAVRAVGTANGRNPISIIVPCHRVIGSNGNLTGYAGGLSIKTKLLDLEKHAKENGHYK